MGQTKLTLRLDAALIRRAKAYARRSGRSVSRMVADFFEAVTSTDGRPDDDALTPTVRSLRGILKDADIDNDEYIRHLEEKYR